MACSKCSTVVRLLTLAIVPGSRHHPESTSFSPSNAFFVRPFCPGCLCGTTRTRSFHAFTNCLPFPCEKQPFSCACELPIPQLLSFYIHASNGRSMHPSQLSDVPTFQRADASAVTNHESPAPSPVPNRTAERPLPYAYNYRAILLPSASGGS